MSLSALPQPIKAFLQATASRDRAALLSSFADDAILIDAGEPIEVFEVISVQSSFQRVFAYKRQLIWFAHESRRCVLGPGYLPRVTVP